MNPSFFKPLIRDFAEKLQIPPAFVEKFGEHYDPNWVLKCEETYEVMTEEWDGRHYIRNGWPLFVRDHKLELGDFIVFSLVDHSVFEVTVFEPSMCEKHICDHHPIKVEETDTSSDSNYTKEPSPKRTKRPNLLHIDREDSEEPSPKRTKRPNLLHIDREDCEDGLEEELFKIIINEVHKTNLPVPSWFATKGGLAKKKEIKLSDPKGKEYVATISQGTDVELTRGWTTLCAANRLKKGDKCTFRYISGESVNCIKVDIQRGRGRPPKYPTIIVDA